MEKSLVLIKPDAVERNIIGNIINFYEENSLKVTDMKMISASREVAEKHYSNIADKPFFGEVLDYITRSPIVALIVEGENAISKVRYINGPTNPEQAPKNTIRGIYGKDVQENSVHASDSMENANREIIIWFGK
ncbi:nucleoside-diphosphate kinase [Miniphocaeibacter massiliensis]|uniref:nucleoside-diphosphate kinase n=1 Tax=Miniphocaeibacter massiliensis TaxID=2041841 RepID=UPI000C1BCC5B|nr:nucleoside-diphosphate kinase [Miniphocaeibacter massiliensis]